MSQEIIRDRKIYRILTDATNKVWNRINFLTNAKSVDADDGNTLEYKVGAINGITSDISANADDIAISTKGFNNALGGLKFGIDSNGDYGYYKAGADSVTPFSSKFVNLCAIVGSNGTESRPLSFATRNDTNEDYFGDYETGMDMNTATMTFKKSGKYKILFRTQYRVTPSKCSLKHNDTFIVEKIEGNNATTEYEIDAIAGDTLRVSASSITSGYGFQLSSAIVYLC